MPDCDKRVAFSVPLLLLLVRGSGISLPRDVTHAGAARLQRCLERGSRAEESLQPTEYSFLPSNLIPGSVYTVSVSSLVCTSQNNLTAAVAGVFSQPVNARQLASTQSGNHGVGSLLLGPLAALAEFPLHELPRTHPWWTFRDTAAFAPQRGNPSVTSLFAQHDEEVRFFDFQWHSRHVWLTVDSRAYDFSRFACYFLWADAIVNSVRQDLESWSASNYSSKEVRFIDVGCGSGWLSVMLKIAFPQEWFQVYCSDLSTDALELARENALLNAVDVTFLHGSELENLCEWRTDASTCDVERAGGTFDWIFFYPPQIEASPLVERAAGADSTIARIFDAPGGLASDIFVEDGLNHFRSMLPQLQTRLQSRGRAYLGVDLENMVAVQAMYESSAGISSAQLVWDAEDDQHVFTHPCPSSLLEVLVGGASSR